MTRPAQLSLQEWDSRYDQLVGDGLKEPSYGGRLSRHLQDGDKRLLNLKFDNSAASLNLWNFLLSEEDRLLDSRKRGNKLIGAMKDLGTVPVMAYALPGVTAFYPDGAWWIPCVMELDAGLLSIADDLGVDESFCPVRAMLGAFATEAHFPIPDLLICSAGAVCDDFSAIAQRLNGMGHPIMWWNIPRRRLPDQNEPSVVLTNGTVAPESQVAFVKSELEMVAKALEELTGEPLTNERLKAGIAVANRFRKALGRLREACFTADISPMPALELMIAEMLAIHFCSDREESISVVEGLLDEVEQRIKTGHGYGDSSAVRVFWVNPVADLRVMNYLEDCGGRICGTDYLFTHALDPVSEDEEPIDALACAALADPMTGSFEQRAERICRDIERFGAEALIVSRIPGASHCALETEPMIARVRERFDIPVVDIEVPPLSDADAPSIRTRIEALIESARNRKTRD